MTVYEACHHYAPMGMSMSAVAGELGIEQHVFFRLVRAKGLRHMFDRSRYSRDCKGGGKGWPKGKPQVRGPRYSNAEILAEVARYDHPYQFAACADISLSTVVRRFGTWSEAKALSGNDKPEPPEVVEKLDYLPPIKKADRTQRFWIERGTREKRKIKGANSL